MNKNNQKYKSVVIPVLCLMSLAHMYIHIHGLYSGWGRCAVELEELGICYKDHLYMERTLEVYL